MKTTFKKTMAALSAAAVVAASAAVMAVPASAAGATVDIADVTLTLDELKAANYEVTLAISVDSNWTKLCYGAQMGDGLTYVSAFAMPGGAVEEEKGALWFAGAASSPTKADFGAGELTVKVSEDAAEGDVFTVKGLTVAPAGNSAEFANTAESDETSTPAVVDGVITIAAAATTPKPTETEAPTTAAPTEATTAAPVATTTKAPAKSTSSPKTGDALPIAGVAAAVAVIGGVAFVAKKRK